MPASHIGLCAKAWLALRIGPGQAVPLKSRRAGAQRTGIIAALYGPWARPQTTAELALLLLTPCKLSGKNWTGYRLLAIWRCVALPTETE